MIGTRVESRNGLPWVSTLLMAVGFAILAGGIALGQAPLAIGSALPISVGLIFLLLGRDRAFVADFGEESIEVEHPAATIPYATLRNVKADGVPHDPRTFRKAAATLLVEHEGGVLQLPRRLNERSDDVYRFLAGRVPPNGGREVNPALAEYLERQEGYFGPEQVWTYRAATRRTSRGRFRRFRAFCFGLMLAGAAWMVAGFGGFAEMAWAGAGVMCSGLGLCFFLVTLADHQGSGQFVRNWKKASLVIGPQGMAMVQGDIQGEVRWPELLEVRFRPKPATFRFSASHGLNGVLLKVKGAEILIADIYDRPLYIIYERILASSGKSSPVDIDDL